MHLNYAFIFCIFVEIKFGYFWKLFIHFNFVINMNINYAFENVHINIDII
jgi:hypothetical protein